jgi:hypothetical protein
MEREKGDLRIKLGKMESGDSVPLVSKGFSTETDASRARQRAGKSKTDFTKVRPATWVALVISVLGLSIVLYRVFSAPSDSEALNFDVEAESTQYETHRKMPHGSATDMRSELQLIKILENTGRRKEAEHALQKLLLSLQGDQTNPVYQLVKEHLAGYAREVTP